MTAESRPLLTDEGFFEGGRLYWTTLGNGHPVLFLHGVGPGIDHRMWDPQVNAFAQHFMVGRYDLRAFGQTTASSTPFSRVCDLVNVLVHRGLWGAHLVGFSLGAGVALNFALQRPDGVGRLVLVSINPPPFPVPADEVAFNTPKGLEQLQQLAVPTLLVFGELDTSGTKEFAVEFASRAPDATLAAIPGAGHAVNSDQPKVFNSTVLKFLAADSPPRT